MWIHHEAARDSKAVTFLNSPPTECRAYLSLAAFGLALSSATVSSSGGAQVRRAVGRSHLSVCSALADPSAGFGECPSDAFVTDFFAADFFAGADEDPAFASAAARRSFIAQSCRCSPTCSCVDVVLGQCSELHVHLGRHTAFRSCTAGRIPDRARLVLRLSLVASDALHPLVPTFSV